MPELWVKHPVTVKAKVTSDLKKRLASEVQDAIRRLDLEVGQLDFQLKRLSFEGEKQNQAGLKPQLEAEKQKRLEKRAELLAKIREIGRLEDGSLILQGTVECMSRVETGTDWDALFAATITVQDGKVVAIKSDP